MLSNPHPIDMAIGGNLRNYRLLRGMTQAELGQAIPEPISFQQIQKYEKGTNRISASRLVELCTVLNCRVQHMLEGVELPEGNTTVNLAMLDKLPPEHQQVVSNLVEALAKQLARDLNSNTKALLYHDRKL